VQFTFEHSNTATEHEETMLSGNVFQMLTIQTKILSFPCRFYVSHQWMFFCKITLKNLHVVSQRT